MPILFPNPTHPLPADSHINSSSSSESIRQFHTSLPHSQPTPLTPLPKLAQHLGLRAVFVKDESQRFGLPSFKILGASWGCFRAVCAALQIDYTSTSITTLAELQQALLLREKAQKEEKIALYTASEGNHGRAVAYMARLLGLEAHVFVPEYMHSYTKSCIESDGAEIHIVQGGYDLAVSIAAEAAADQKGIAVLVQDTAWNGYEQIPAWIVEGYSTLMREMDEQLQALGLSRPGAVVTPVGVGSLASAVARYCKEDCQRGGDIKVVAVEPDAGACLYASLAAGESVSVKTKPSIMNGSCCGTLSSIAWDVLRHTVDASVTISDWESHQAVQYLQGHGISAGPCGGSTLAALRCLTETQQDKDRIALDQDAVVVLLSTEGARPYPVPQEAST